MAKLMRSTRIGLLTALVALLMLFAAPSASANITWESYGGDSETQNVTWE